MADVAPGTIAALGDDEHVQGLLREVCALTGMRFSAIAYVSERQWIAMQVEDRIEFGLDPGGELEISKTICDEIRCSGKEVIIDDTEKDPDWWSHPVPILYGFRSYASLPLQVDGHFFGTLCAIDPEPRTDPLAAMHDQLEALATRAAGLIANLLKAKPDIAAILRPSSPVG